MPKVSVIVPVYGVEKYIERCARSLFEQTLDDIEYLFIDDCTPDKSMDILKKVLEDYPNRKDQVVIHRMEKNCGQALVRKWGILNASGDYIIHCDSDDWVSVDMYCAMYEKAVDEDADIVVCDYVTTDGTDSFTDVVHIGCPNTDRDSFINNMLFQRVAWSLWNKLFKKDVYYKGEFRFPEGAMGEDMALTLQLIWNCEKIAYLPQAAYHYNIANNFSLIHSREPDIVLSKFHQASENACIVIDKFEKNNKSKDFTRGLMYLKYNEKQILFPLVKNKKIRKMWRNAFKEINAKVITFTNVRWQDKVKFYMALSGLVLWRQISTTK